MQFDTLEIAEGFLTLDPAVNYPERGAGLVADIVGAKSFRLRWDDGRTVESSPPPPVTADSISLPLKRGRQSIGTLSLYGVADDSANANGLRLARWGARMLSRGLCIADRLVADPGLGDHGGRVDDALSRAPLTPRERDVVRLLMAGAATRSIAEQTGLTVATVNTYLKRIFSKLGVHSRVELMAQMAGTVGARKARSVGLAQARTSASTAADQLDS